MPIREARKELNVNRAIASIHQAFPAVTTKEIVVKPVKCFPEVTPEEIAQMSWESFPEFNSSKDIELFPDRDEQGIMQLIKGDFSESDAGQCFIIVRQSFAERSAGELYQEQFPELKPRQTAMLIRK
jgi:hypothetical protein